MEKQVLCDPQIISNYTSQHRYVIQGWYADHAYADTVHGADQLATAMTRALDLINDDSKWLSDDNRRLRVVTAKPTI